LLRGHAEDRAHARFLMFEDVAVEHPIAGIVGDEGDLGGFLLREQHGVGERRRRERLPVAREVIACFRSRQSPIIERGPRPRPGA